MKLSKKLAVLGAAMILVFVLSAVSFFALLRAVSLV